ncbi:hypothetical protein STEG23_003029, partial [Scotinomys teguina]
MHFWRVAGILFNCGSLDTDAKESEVSEWINCFFCDGASSRSDFSSYPPPSHPDPLPFRLSLENKQASK